jgi:hypothetical protein
MPRAYEEVDRGWMSGLFLSITSNNAEPEPDSEMQ